MGLLGKPTILGNPLRILCDVFFGSDLISVLKFAYEN